MNNTINQINNVSFNARYLKIHQPDKIPQKIHDAIYKNDAIEEFLKAGKPKTIWGKILDLFKKDKPLNIKYTETIVALPKKVIPTERLNDKYSKACNLKFQFGNKKGFISTEQQGLKRQAGSVPKPNEDYRYKPPIETAEDKMVKELDSLKDLSDLLK